MSIQVSTRIDPSTKKHFDLICETIGISPSNALSMFIKSVINYNGIPFNAIIPPTNNNTQSVNLVKMSREAMFGCMQGEFKISDDFDAPLEDFKEYM